MKKVKIIDFEGKKLLGLRIKNTNAQDQTLALWQRFKPRVKEISSRIGDEFYSVERFPPNIGFESFTPFTEYEKWAAVEVDGSIEQIPFGMQPLIIPPGKYARIIHCGPVSTFYKTLQYVFGEFLPASPYVSDNRPQFEVMGKDYLPNDPKAEEEVWVPIKGK